MMRMEKKKTFLWLKNETIFRNFCTTWNENYDMIIKCFGSSSNVSFRLLSHRLIVWLEVIMMDCTCQFFLPHVVWVLTKYVSNNLPYHRSSWNMFVNKVSKRLFNLMRSRRISTGHSWCTCISVFYLADLRLRMILESTVDWFDDSIFTYDNRHSFFLVILLLALHIILHYTTTFFFVVEVSLRRDSPDRPT